MLRRLIRGFRTGTAPQPPTPTPTPTPTVSPLWCGLQDAALDGWFRQDSGELLKGFPIDASDVVLDVGCGEGMATLFAARQGASVIFSDTEADKVQALSEQPQLAQARHARALVSDSNPLPLEAGTASKVICLEVLEHVDDPAQVMAELVRVGKPGAQYLLSVPDPVGEQLQQGIAPDAYFQSPNHVRIFSREDFATLVESAGLQIEHRQASGFFWVMNMIFYWAAERAAGRELQGAVRDQVVNSHLPLMSDWAQTWKRLLDNAEGVAIKRQLDQLMPKSQVIIARKPAQESSPQ